MGIQRQSLVSPARGWLQRWLSGASARQSQRRRRIASRTIGCEWKERTLSCAGATAQIGQRFDREVKNFARCDDDKVSAPVVAALGFIGFLFALVIGEHGSMSSDSRMLLLLLLTSVPMILVDLLVNKVFLRPSAGLTMRGHSSPERCFRKYCGLLASLAGVSGAYWLLPVYASPLYQTGIYLFSLCLLGVAVVAPFYIAWTDGRMEDPTDEYFKVGAFLLGERPAWEPGELRNHIAAWAIKGFFLPIMTGFLYTNSEKFFPTGIQVYTFSDFFVSALGFIFILDVTFGAIGYLLTFRILDAHVRRADTTAWGWGVTLICYPPFLTVVADGFHTMKSESTWQDALLGMPYVYVAWGFAILVLLAIYVWATVCFGFRFSNLTNRGIIDFGPYRLVKHPAYLAKCSAWWLMSAPFFAFSSIELCIKACLLLFFKCLIYYFRAKAEERLLSSDSSYLEYSKWMASNGLWARLKRWIKTDGERDNPKLRQNESAII